jgi:hypothetical protein
MSGSSGPSAEQFEMARAIADIPDRTTRVNLIAAVIAERDEFWARLELRRNLCPMESDER